MSEEKEFITVNRAIGEQPKIGPFPAGQILPCGLILIFSYIAKQALVLNWIQMALLAIWMMGTWWIITGTKAWRFFLKWIPAPNWVRVLVHYSSLLDQKDKKRQ